MLDCFKSSVWEMAKISLSIIKSTDSYLDGYLDTIRINL